MNVFLKKWVKILLIIATIPLVASGVLYYILKNNLKYVIEYAVEKQTHGGYTFQSTAITLSLIGRKITIDNTVLARKDTTNIPIYYNVTIPKAYLSIDNWRALLVDKRLAIDSFSVERPEIIIHDYKVRQKSNNNVGFHTSLILGNLQKTLNHLQAKSFHIQDGSFALFNRNNPEPLVIKELNLTVHNFLKIDNNNSHVLGSDNLELILGRQRWTVSDGNNTVSFKRLRFSSNRQLVEIDSIQYHKPATAATDEMNLRAEKFFFNSRHLPAIYQKGELSLDTLICVKPVLTMPFLTKKDRVKKTDIHANLKSLFKNITIRYTEIRDGAIVLAGQKNNTLKVGTQKANLLVYNLTFNPKNQHPFTTDSIKLNLNDISFYSKDSLFKISVEKFTLLNNDVIFKNVRYGPASKKMAGKGLLFTAPALRLKNINLEDLMQKRLVASDAELIEPNITLVATGKAPSKPKITVTAPGDTVTHKKTDIYQTLHSFGELLQVDRFHIINGGSQYTLVGSAKPVTATLKKVNATILVKDLLASDSLIDIKHAIADLRIHEMSIASNGLNMRLSNYKMDGQQRQNWVDNLQIDLATGTSLKASKIYWEAFSWDILQQTKLIRIERIRVHDLLVDAKIKSTPATTASTASQLAKPQDKGLPDLRIDHCLAEHLRVKMALPKEALAGFQGEDIQVSKLTTDSKHFQWVQFLGKLNNLYLRQPGGRQVTIAQVALHSHEHTTLTNLQYADHQPGSTMDVSLPKMQIKGPFLSTNFSTINLTSIQIERPELTMVTEVDPKATTLGPATAFTIPLNLTLKDLTVNQAQVKFTTKKGRDSTRIQAVVNVEATSLRARKQETATFASIRVSPADGQLSTPKLKTTLPSATIQLTNGKLSATKDGKASLTTQLLANLTLIDLHPVLTAKKKVTAPELRIKAISGSIDMPNFRWTAGREIAWPTFIEHTNLAITSLSFKSATTAIKAEKASWGHKAERLQLEKFQISPTITKAEFMAPPHFQSDYITLQGDLAQLNGLNATRWYTDSTWVVNHILVKNIIADVSRDKRLPDPAVLPNKLMPTRLLSGIKARFHIDSISVVNSQVNYHETSPVTNRVSTIPLHEINGTIKSITNQPTKSTDSLKLLASTNLLGLHINRVHYRESYRDSLSGFHMLLNTSDLQLPELNPITNPMAAVDLDGGYLEPIMARIAGNKYASVGNMRFYYKDLKLRLLGHPDTTRRSLLTRIKNFVANSFVLRKKNQEDGRIFYDRDPTKFIFGYWIKTITSGVMTSVGITANKKYHASYLKLRQKHTLPAEDE